MKCASPSFPKNLIDYFSDVREGRILHIINIASFLFQYTLICERKENGVCIRITDFVLFFFLLSLCDILAFTMLHFLSKRKCVR